MKALLLSLSLLFMFLYTYPAAAQDLEDCGVVESIDFPVDMDSTFSRRFDDFARFRGRWGGNHTGADLAFNRTGDLVRAAMRGRVTLSNPEEWDTELGVVVLRHMMPDGSTVYSVYGHMVESDLWSFPPVGACVARGDIIGTIGDPLQSRPHLHFEIRNILAFEGGPGYVDVNPIDLGWEHPLEFIFYWQARLRGLVSAAIHLPQAPTLPIVLLETGGLAYARGDQVFALSPDGAEVWRIGGEGEIVGLARLPGDRLAVRTATGTIVVAQGGRYLARWSVDPIDAPVLTVGETLAVLTSDGLTGYTSLGAAVWTIPSVGRSVSLAADSSAFVWASRDLDGRVIWRVIAPDGTIIVEHRLDDSTPVTSIIPTSGWAVLDGANTLRLSGGSLVNGAHLPINPGISAAITGSPSGDLYVYAGDNDRTLLAIAADGSVRWRVRYPVASGAYPPIMGVGSGCALYTLDSDGMLNAFDTQDGTLRGQVQLYAGGSGTAQPLSRVMQVFPNDQLVVSAGFLSALLINGAPLAGEACATTP